MKILCGVPPGKCCGADTSVGKTSTKAHGSSKEAFVCYARYLLSQGYEQVGSREFKKPGECILVLGKKSRFGHALRKGKTGEGMTKGKRFCHRGLPGTKAIHVV